MIRNVRSSNQFLSSTLKPSLPGTMAEPAPPSTTTPTCTPLEQEVLDEYARLLANLNKVLRSSPFSDFSLRVLRRRCELREEFLADWGPVQLASQINSLADRPTAEVLDGLRMLERKTSLVCTLLKASVYSIVLQQQIYGGEDGEG